MEAGPELDVLIAEKVFGQSAVVLSNGWAIYTDPARGVGNNGVPFYSRDIGAAWRVMEKFPMHIKPHGSQWFCGRPMMDRNGFGDVGWEYYATADTAPLAICLAALKAVGC